MEKKDDNTCQKDKHKERKYHKNVSVSEDITLFYEMWIFIHTQLTDV